MRGLDPATIAALSDPHVIWMVLVKIEFDSATLAFNSSQAEFTYDGTQYIGGGTLGSVSNSDENSALDPTDYSIILSGVKDEVLASVLNEPYLNRKASCLLAAMDFILSPSTWLILNGYLQNASFIRSGNVAYDDITYGPNTAISTGTKYVHHGTFINEVPIIDLFEGNLKSNVTDTGQTINILDRDITLVAVGTDGFYGQDIINYVGYSSVTIWIWSEISGDVDIRFGANSAAAQRIALQSGYSTLEYIDFFGALPSFRQILIDNRATATPNMKVAVISQLTKTPYSIFPIYIPTSEIGPGIPVSIDTAASNASDLHGATLDLTLPENAEWLDLLDGKSDGAELWDDNTTSISGPVTYDGEYYQFTDSATYQQIAQIGAAIGRYEVATDIIDYIQGQIGYSEGGVGNIAIPNNNGLYTYRVEEPPASNNLSIYRISAAGNPNLKVKVISAVEISPAVGTISISNLSIIPSKTEWQTVGVLNIMAGETGNQIIYIDTDGLIKLTDGTNTAVSPVEYVAGTNHNIDFVFGSGFMHIIMDEVVGTQVPFVGTFSPGNTLKVALDNEDIMTFSDISNKDAVTSLQIIGEPINYFNGLIDSVEATYGSTSEIRINVKNRLAEWSRARTSRYTNQEQLAKFPGDNGFEFVSEVSSREVTWPAKTWFENNKD